MLEMKDVRSAFELYEHYVKNLVGYQKIKCHFIFDENFKKKARLVGGGHTTDPPSSLTYSSVVSRDSVRILLLTSYFSRDTDVYVPRINANDHGKSNLSRK